MYNVVTITEAFCVFLVKCASDSLGFQFKDKTKQEEK